MLVIIIIVTDGHMVFEVSWNFVVIVNCNHGHDYICLGPGLNRNQILDPFFLRVVTGINESDERTLRLQHNRAERSVMDS